MIATKPKKRQPERIMQEHCYQYFFLHYRNTGALFNHCPNENLRTSNRIQAIAYNNILTKSGRQKGFPDIQILYKSKSIFFELKAGKNKPSLEQQIIIKQLQDNNFDVFVVYSVDEFVKHLDNFMKSSEL